MTPCGALGPKDRAGGVAAARVADRRGAFFLLLYVHGARLAVLAWSEPRSCFFCPNTVCTSAHT